MTGSHCVFAPEASSPSSFHVPAGHAVHTRPEMYWFAEHDDAAPHALASVSPSPVPGMAEFAAFVLPAVQSAHVQVDPDLAAYLFAGHVQDVAAPPVLVEPTGHASHESPSQYWLASQFAVHVVADPPALVVPVAQALHSLSST